MGVERAGIWDGFWSDEGIWDFEWILEVGRGQLWVEGIEVLWGVNFDSLFGIVGFADKILR